MVEASRLSLGEKLNRMSGVVNKPDHAGKPKNEMDKDAFMRMLMEQIKYQDPFNPVKNEQFAQHLASMSQLEQQVTMNKQLEKIVMQGNNSQVAALQVVGKHVVADKGGIYHDAEKSTDISFEMPEAASEAYLVIENGVGEEIRQMELGPQIKGRVDTKWDGYTDTQMPSPNGRYSFKVVAKNEAGIDIDVETKVNGKVTGVTSFQGQTFLLVGKNRVALSDIESISLPEDAVKKDDPSNAAVQVAAKTAGVSQKSDQKVNETSGTNNETNKESASESAKKLEDLLPLLYR